MCVWADSGFPHSVASSPLDAFCCGRQFQSLGFENMLILGANWRQGCFPKRSLGSVVNVTIDWIIRQGMVFFNMNRCSRLSLNWRRNYHKSKTKKGHCVQLDCLSLLFLHQLKSLGGDCLPSPDWSHPNIIRVIFEVNHRLVDALDSCRGRDVSQSSIGSSDPETRKLADIAPETSLRQETDSRTSVVWEWATRTSVCIALWMIESEQPIRSTRKRPTCRWECDSLQQVNTFLQAPHALGIVITSFVKSCPSRSNWWWVFSTNNHQLPDGIWPTGTCGRKLLEPRHDFRNMFEDSFAFSDSHC
jgi:hypothetical protein